VYLSELGFSSAYNLFIGSISGEIKWSEQFFCSDFLFQKSTHF